MALQVYQTTPADLEAVRALLQSVFKASPDAPFLERRLLYWKYYTQGPQWDGSRSYAMKQGELIQAHCGVWPMNLNFAEQQVSCLCYVDWVSHRRLPGAGVLLKKKLMKLADTAIVVGGTADTRAVVPKIGYTAVGEVVSLARVIRPWQQFRTRPKESFGKDAARLLRNTKWSFDVAGEISPEWSALEVKSFGAPTLDDAGPAPVYPTPWRSPAYLNYWLDSPAVSMTAFVIMKGGEDYGHFLLNRVGGQTRIADLRLRSEASSEWTAAFRLAAKTAADIPDTCEILALASTPLALQSLTDSGFRQRGSAPLFLYDPHKKLTGAPSIFINMIDGDGAYLHDPLYPYVT
jgi:hypothetical protein